MIPATAAGSPVAALVAAGALASLWRAAQRHGGPARHAWWWFALAVVFLAASLIAGQQGLLLGPGMTVLSLASIPALLFPPAVALGLVMLGLAGAAPQEPWSFRARRGLAGATARLWDGYVLASALFLIGWVTVFGPALSRSGESPAAFAGALVQPVLDVVFLGATLAVVWAAGWRALLPYLALAAVTVSDSLSVDARIAGTSPGAAALLAGLVALALLGLAPAVPRVRTPGEGRGGGRQSRATTTAAAAAAAVAALVVVLAVIVTGQLPRPVVLVVLATGSAVLGVRVVGLAGRISPPAPGPGAQFRELAERITDVVLLCDAGGVIRYASRAAADYGYPPESLPGTPISELLHPEDRPGGMRALSKAVTAPHDWAGRYACRVRAADGSWRHVESTVSRYGGPAGPERLLITARDVSTQVALRHQVTHLISHDGLTGLPNRAAMEQRSQEVLVAAGESGPGASSPGESSPGESGPGDGGGTWSSRRQARAGVILLDLDGFAAVNGVVGRNAGDLLLAQVARRLRASAGPRDTVARWGGDAFAVLTTGADSAQEIVELAERLTRTLASPSFRVAETDLSLSASAGVAFADGGPAGLVWRNAEQALSSAKQAGGRRVEVFGGSAGAPLTGVPAGRGPGPG